MLQLQSHIREHLFTNFLIMFFAHAFVVVFCVPAAHAGWIVFCSSILVLTGAFLVLPCWFLGSFQLDRPLRCRMHEGE